MSDKPIPNSSFGINPLFDEILREEAALEKMSFKLQEKIMRYKMPKFYFLHWHNKRIEKKIACLVKRFDHIDLKYKPWLVKADEFRQSPTNTILVNDPLALAFTIVHCANVVSNKIEQMERSRYYNMLSINKLRSDYDNKVSFRIALSSWIYPNVQEKYETILSKQKIVNKE